MNWSGFAPNMTLRIAFNVYVNIKSTGWAVIESYSHVSIKRLPIPPQFNGPSRTRTQDRLFMREVLSPTELMVQTMACKIYGMYCICVVYKSISSSHHLGKYNNDYLRDIKYNQNLPAILNKLTRSLTDIRFLSIQ